MMTNSARKCECGSGYMPTIMDQGRNRWACRECAAYGYNIGPMPALCHECLMRHAPACK